jgi:hypothetical protein
VAFLGFLGRDILSRGAAKDCTAEIYMLAFETPGFLRAIEKATKAGRIADSTSVVWFLVAISRERATARDNPLVQSIAALVSATATPCAATAQLLTLLVPGQLASSLQAKLDASKIGSLEELRSLQPKHDNDFPLDYREIAIVSTAAELNCEQGEGGVPLMSTIQAQLGGGDEAGVTAAVLDRQFRLLREDMIAPTKEELKEELAKRPADRRKLFGSPQVVGIELKPRPCVMIRVEMTPALRGTNYEVLGARY